MASMKVSGSEGDTRPEASMIPDGWSAVAHYSKRRAAQEAGLVILAMGKAYWMLPVPDGYLLCVETKSLESARAELDAVARLGSSTRRQTEPRRMDDFRPGWVSFVLYGALLVGVFILQERYGLVDAGRVDAVAMGADGELWRAVTALTLHADVVHLVSNLVAGAGFAFFVARFFGSGAGWLLILIGGVLGNGLNAAVYYPEPHFSVGASTAVFAALGLLTGVGLRDALATSGEGLTLPRWLLPVFGGLTLLGMLGVGEGPVDVAAHISGFLCGSLLGFLAAWRQSFFKRLERYGFWLGCVSIGIVALGWVIALVV